MFIGRFDVVSMNDIIGLDRLVSYFLTYRRNWLKLNEYIVDYNFPIQFYVS